jgi:hypothetical protein
MQQVRSHFSILGASKLYNRTLRNSRNTIIFVIVKLPDPMPVDSSAIVRHGIRNMNDDYALSVNLDDRVVVKLTIVAPVREKRRPRHCTIER